MFDQLNEQYFAGSLPPITIKVTRADGYFGKFAHPKNPSGAACTIYISGCINRTLDDFRDSLLHEMVHYDLYVKGVTEQDDHGPIFMEHAARVGLRNWD